MLKNFNKTEDKKFRWILYSSFCLGIFAFFSNELIMNVYQGINNQDPYLVLSQRIFKKNYSYLSESILLPLIANILGANKSPQGYLLLSSLITLTIMPTVAIYGQGIRNNRLNLIVLIIIYFATFKYLWGFWLGFPDPLAIVLISIAGLSLKNRTKLIAAFLAGLTHFSMAIIGLASVALIIYFQNHSNKIDAIKKIILGIIFSKIFLTLWYFIFGYKLNSRLDIVLDTGLNFYFQKYLENPLSFWLIPGILFLATYSFIIIFYIIHKKTKYALVLLMPLFFSYIASFITTDGLRIFAVTISGAYLLILYRFIEHNSHIILFFQKKIKKIITKLVSIQKGNEIYIGSGLLIASIWAIIIAKAKENELLINEITFLMKNISQESIFYFILILFSMIIFVAVSFPGMIKKYFYLKIINFIFIFPFFIIAFQYARSLFADSFSLSFLNKLIILIVLASLSWINIGCLKFCRVLTVRALNLIKANSM